MTKALTGGMLGGIVGTAVNPIVGPAVGSVVGSLLGQLLPGPADVLSDLLGGLGADGVTDTTRYLWRRVKTAEKEALGNLLQEAWQTAFREAIYDIGGKSCFPKAWRQRPYKLHEIDEYHLEYPYSLLRDYHKRPDLAKQVCTCLQGLVQTELASPEDPTTYVAELADLDAVAEWVMATAVLPHLQGAWLAELQAIDEKVKSQKEKDALKEKMYDLEAHLRRALFPRWLAHLGHNLQRQPAVWRAFNQLMWQCLKVELQQITEGQAVIQKQLAEWEGATDTAQISTEIGQLLTTVDQAQRQQGEQLETLMVRLITERQLLASQIGREHQQTRAEIQQAAHWIVNQLPADTGLNEATLQKVTHRYQELLVAQLGLHRFQGIAQFQKAIRLPLAEFYLELGLLPWQDERRDEEQQAQLLLEDETARLKLFERRLTERVTEGMADSQRLLILGEPGAGKTMTLHFTALMLAQGQAKARLGLSQPYLPVLVRLADYARTDLSLYGYLCQHMEANFAFDRRLPDVLRRVLDEGVCMVLLDGLDEISTDPIKGQLLRANVLEQVQAFADQWCHERRPNRLVVTSRKEGYVRGDLVDFDHVELSPLRPPDEIERFLRRWYRAYERAYDEGVSGEQVEARMETAVTDLLPQILSLPSVRYLATNPLMLTILVLVYESVERLPDRRAKLYEICAETLIESWRQKQTGKERPLAQLSANQIFGVMGRLAYWLHAYRPGGTATIEEWEKQLNIALKAKGVKENAAAIADQFLHYARHEAGLLAERSMGQIGFFHLTFEEYLAGYAIAHAADLTEQDGMIEAHWEDPRWREVILLAVGEAAVCAEMPPVTNNLIWKLLSLEAEEKENRGREIVLAGRALLDVGEENIPTPTAQDIKRKLRETMQNRDLATGQLRYGLEIRPPIRAEAGEVLDRLGWLPDDLYEWVLCKKCGQDGGDLWVAKYPVTNAQFALFIEAKGYDNLACWGSEESEGWQWRQREKRPYFEDDLPTNIPAYWHDGRFGKDRRGYPVVGVSWYEAVAYSNWLFTLLNQLREDEASMPTAWQKLVAGLGKSSATTIRLPHEEEWVKVAGSDKNTRYAWDEGSISVTSTDDTERIIARANVRESKIGQTSPVGMYLQGESKPYGLMDMSGNVWEWTNSWYDEAKRGRVLRGGSWVDNYRIARVADRNLDYPDYALNDNGFRPVAPGSGS